MNIFNQDVAATYADKFNTFGINAIRLTTATVLIWIGLMKFTAYEAGAIEGLVASSPLVGWLYSVFSLQATSNIIGSIEITTAVALLIGFKSHKVGLLGAIAAAFTFLLTSSFLLSAPVWEASLGGFPALSVVPGQFLLKDVVLLASALALIGNSFKGIATGNE